MCSRMHSLQVSRLSFEITIPELGAQLYPVNIPSLTTLDITCEFDIVLALLDNISPAPGCSLQCKLTSGPTTNKLSPAQYIIGRFANNYFSHHRSTSFSLQFTPQIVCVEDVSDDNLYDRSRNKFYFFTGPRIPLLALAHCFTKKLYQRVSAHVRTLHQYIELHRMGPDTLKLLFRKFLITITAAEKRFT